MPGVASVSVSSACASVSMSCVVVGPGPFGAFVMSLEYPRLADVHPGADMPSQPGPPAGADDFADVVRAHGDAVFGFVLRRVGGDRARAEDLSQEAFLRAWRGRRGFREETSMRGWLCAIAANVVRDDARRRRRRPAEVPAPEWFDVPSVAEDPAQFDALDRLRTALAALPANQREMFLLRERDGHSYADSAGALGCPVGTVMSGLSRARARLVAAVRS